MRVNKKATDWYIKTSVAFFFVGNGKENVNNMKLFV